MEILLPKHSSLPVARVRGELQARFPAWGCLACAFFAPHRVAPGSNKRIGRRTCEMFWRAAMVRWPLPFGQWQCHWQTVAFTAARDHVQVLLARVQQVRVRVYAAPLRDWRRHSGWHCLAGINCLPAAREQLGFNLKRKRGCESSSYCVEIPLEDHMAAALGMDTVQCNAEDIVRSTGLNPTIRTRFSWRLRLGTDNALKVC